MTFDLIVTARNHNFEILRFLNSIVKQKEDIKIRILFANQEVLFRSEELNFLQLFPSIQLISKDIPLSPLSHARNMAIDLGLQSEIVGFPDDDCWYSPDVLASLSRKFKERLDVDCICTNVFDPIKNISYGSRPVNKEQVVGYHNIFTLPVSVGIFIRRSALEKIGTYFRKDMGVGTNIGSGEETELISRLLSNNFKILYVGSISVYHPSYDLENSTIDKFYKYGFGYGYLSTSFIINGKYIVILDWLKTTIKSLIACIIYLPKIHKKLLYFNRLKGVIDGTIYFINVARSNKK